MRALLDTHAFLWAIAEEQKLSSRAREIYAGANLWLSVASIWEILTKVKSGRLPFPEPAGPYLVKRLVQDRIEILPIKLDHALRMETLELHHRDPFDRMLIAQSLEENLPLITADPLFANYPIRVIW